MGGCLAKIKVKTAVLEGPHQQLREKPRGAAPPRSEPLLGKPYEDVKLYYTIGRELGRGQFGITYLCTEKSTGEQFACKSIDKKQIVHMCEVEDVKREVQIMHHMNGKPNIVELKCVYEDRKSVHLVMDLCAGGELFDRIIAKGHYTERAAASTFRSIVNIVDTCHSMGVMHRDIKPENFLFSSRDDASLMKVIDFGLSIFIEEGKVYDEVAGSPYYVAPEVLRRSYGKEADIWSAGVVLYILLCGVPPFWAETKQGIFEAVLCGDIDFESDPWPSISGSAKDLISRMLTRDPKERITCAQALEHPWLRVGGEASDKPIESAVVFRMKKFMAMNKLKKLALMVIVETLSTEEIQGLKQTFGSMDTDNSGTVTYDELKAGLARLGSSLLESEIQQLMEAADVDKNGVIDFIEFVTATVHKHKLEKHEQLWRAFQHFDKDNNGYITVDELETAMKEHGTVNEAEVEEIIADVDKNNDGKIDFKEFEAMMRRGMPQRASTFRSMCRCYVKPPSSMYRIRE